METLISVPLSLGREQSLHIHQKQKSSGFFGAISSLASGFRSGTVHIQRVPAGAPAVLDVCADHKIGHDVTDQRVDKRQTIVVHTLSAEPVHIYLRWPRDAGIARLQVATADYHIASELDTPDVPGGATHLAPADVDFVPARELFLASNSGGLSGLLPVDDVLDVVTSSGSASVTLLPLFDTSSHAAKLIFKSNSGTLSINAKLDAATSRAHYPSRDSAVSIHTSSGTIRAVLGLTRSVSVKSNSGAQHITAVLADHSRDRRSDFATTSNSGSQNVAVVAAAAQDDTWPADKAAETGFVCKHKNNSGSVRVAYPDAWQGTVEAHSNSGGISITGEGVSTDKSRSGHDVTGVKGSAPEHHTDVRTSSGSISVKFGEA